MVPIVVKEYGFLTKLLGDFKKEKDEKNYFLLNQNEFFSLNFDL